MQRTYDAPEHYDSPRAYDQAQLIAGPEALDFIAQMRLLIGRKGAITRAQVTAAFAHANVPLTEEPPA